MLDYFIYYASINIMGVIIFGIMLAHDCLSIDRQEKQIKYDHVLIAFMLYFFSDALWAGLDSGIFPVNLFAVLTVDFLIFIFMTAITYLWLRYVMAFEQINNRNKTAVRVTISLPFVVSAIVLIITFLFAPNLLLDENYKTTRLYDVFLVCIPYIYLIAVIVYAIKKIHHEENRVQKRRHLFIGFFPVMVVAGGLMQMILMPSLPIFCFASTIFMLIFYIQNIEAQISRDPLTMLNNRGQMDRYVSSGNNLRMEGRPTFVLMIDVNDFKKINDTYGHAEGDSALIIIAQSLLKVERSHNIPMFLGRYGGDEFVIIAHPANKEEIEELTGCIRKAVCEQCEREGKPYILSVGIGCDELYGETDTFTKCMQRADNRLYLDKEYCKRNGMGTKLN